jgi:hypothetical protein
LKKPGLLQFFACNIMSGLAIGAIEGMVRRSLRKGFKSPLQRLVSWLPSPRSPNYVPSLCNYQSPRRRFWGYWLLPPNPSSSLTFAPHHYPNRIAKTLNNKVDIKLFKNTIYDILSRAIFIHKAYKLYKINTTKRNDICLS